MNFLSAFRVFFIFYFLAQPFFFGCAFFVKSLIVFYLFCVFEILSFRIIIFVTNKN